MKSNLPITSSIGICDGFNLLLPSNLIAEVISAVTLNTANNTEAWSAGHINWRGLDVPVINIEEIILERSPRLRGSHIAIFHGTLQTQDGSESMGKLPFYGVPLQAVPHSFAINEEQDITQRSDQLNINFCQMKIAIKGIAAIIPDITALEQFIIDKL